MRKLVSQLIPFLTLGIAIVAFAFGLMLLAYLFLFGAIVGTILFIINWIRSKYGTRKQPPPQVKGGRIIDADDWKAH